MQAVPGTTFRKHMNIAKGLLSEDDNLLAEAIFSPHSIEDVEKVTVRLELLKHIIRQKDYEDVEAFFDRLRKNAQRSAAL
jgi:prephenate dehydrogenase